jgi:hypothetical protein
MREMKYIVTYNEADKEEIFIFPKTVDHDCMMEVIHRIKNQSWGDWKREYRLPISAGFTDGKTCYGESISLRIESRPEDTELLQC